jgi:hypothetical protein
MSDETLSKREHFAMHFFAALMSNPELFGVNRWEVARDAVRSADALLEVLAEKPAQ